MNGGTSPEPPTSEGGKLGRDEHTVASVNGRRSSSATADTSESKAKPSSSKNTSGAVNGQNDGSTLSDGPTANGGDNGADSEAETLIDSPVKKKDADKPNPPVKSERPPKHRIGSLPVPSGGDDEADSAAVSPAPSTVMSVEKASTAGAKEETTSRQGNVSDNDQNSESLSSTHSRQTSRASSLERAESERAESSHMGIHSPNPRKRKHRASSVSLPNKRPSVDPPKRRLRGLNAEELGGTERSPSPKPRSHRRAVSTQSAFADATAEPTSRKRKANAHGAGKDSKMSRTTWEESDASSETTSHGQSDTKRPPRGISRSTSTPGRPPGREHKRHVNKYGFTRLAEACEDGNLDLVKEWREKDPDQLELAEFAGNKPLQIAALNGNVEVVDYLIDQGCQIDCANVDKDTPLIDAAENGHVDVVNSLLKAGVDPLRQNLKGQQALDAVTDETEDADEIRTALRKAIEAWNSNGAKQRREEEEELRHRAGPTKELLFMARTYENLLKLVQINDRNGVQEFLDARVPVDNAIIAAAAKTGDVYLVNMLLAEVPEKKRGQKPEKRVLSVLGTSHFEMVKFMTELEDFNPHYVNRQGKSWPEIAEERRGPNWRQEKELLQRLYEHGAVIKERRSSSPVTKRDSAKRRNIARAADEESEADDIPRRKNGRKLMSKKEMRVARGKTASDASSDDFDSEAATGPDAVEESSMKPPESPATKRTPTRSRTKSLSAQPPENLHRTRRRSSSFRNSSDHILPPVDEDSERQREEEVKRAAEEAEQARKLQLQKEEDIRLQAEAEAAARQVAEEARKAEEASRKAAEEEARKAEEERKAEADRLAAEEERKRKEEEEMQEALRLHRKEVITSLPAAISHVLDPDTRFDYHDGSAPTYLLRRFAPLQILKHDAKNPLAPYSQGPEGTFWVANIQAAPLIGKQGIELMLRSDVPGFPGSLADQWDTRDVFHDDMATIEYMLTSLAQYEPPDQEVPLVSDPYQENLRMTAGRVMAAAKARERLRNGQAVMRYVRLDDVLRNLDPGLKGIGIEVRFDFLDISHKVSAPDEGVDFVDRIGKFLAVRPTPRTYVDGARTDPGTRPAKGSTTFVVVHEK